MYVRNYKQTCLASGLNENALIFNSNYFYYKGTINIHVIIILSLKQIKIHSNKKNN